MVYAYPDYYEKFKCIAGECRHSCCIGWEIDIDEEALSRFTSTQGELGEELKSKISCEDTPHFILSENERCPFLDERKLCRLITEKARIFSATYAATTLDFAVFCPAERSSAWVCAARKPRG